MTTLPPFPKPSCRLDLRQTLRFGVVGITLHGPFFFRGFRWLDSRFGGAEPTLHSAIVKTAVGQITLFPCYTAAFFLYIGLLEGLPPPQVRARLVQAQGAGWGSGRRLSGANPRLQRS